MTDERIAASLDRVESAMGDILQLTSASVTGVKQAVREDCIRIREEISVRISVSEISLTRHLVVLTHDADFHLLRAYFHASPSLILILTAIYKFVVKVVDIIVMINKILEVVTGESLAYLIDRFIPGFQAAWNDIMNKISQFSTALGWGVDGVHHLMNAANAGADLWGMVLGKEPDTVKMEKYSRLDKLMTSYTVELNKWEANPGEQISKYAEAASYRTSIQGYNTMHNITDKIIIFGDKAERALIDIGTVSSEVLSLRDGMPAFIAKNIPQALWDGIEKVDTTINDRILPSLTNITDRIEELDAVLDSYRQKADELADRIAHPGDLLAEIDKLPGYARQEQLGKIDDVTSMLLRERNEAAFALVEGDLRNFGIIAEALTHSPPPLAFMELELPGRSPGIVAEPRETWFVGDY